jgi:hypothetical protein
MSDEDIILGIMKEAKAYSQERMITPAELIEKCKDKGITNVKSVEAAIVRLIDNDVVEYEMDDTTLQTTELWLL